MPSFDICHFKVGIITVSSKYCILKKSEPIPNAVALPSTTSCLDIPSCASNYDIID